MASLIFLGMLFGCQNKMTDVYYKAVRKWPTGLQAAIAKGNIIEGIEAKE